MYESFTMQVRSDIVAFVRARAQAGSCSVTNFIETILLREKARFEESQRSLTVQAAAELLAHERHALIREADESESERIVRAMLFGAVLDHARHG